MTVDRHRDWLIEQNWLGEWEATHPDFDPTPVYAGAGPSDNRYVTAKTRAEVIEEIDFWILENTPAGPETGSSAFHQPASVRAEDGVGAESNGER